MRKLALSIPVLLFSIGFAFDAPAQTRHKKRKKHKTTHTAKKSESSPGVGNVDMWSDLQGRWTSLDDKKTFFIIRDYTKENYYNDRVVDTTEYNFYNECPPKIVADDIQKKTGRYFVETWKGERQVCYRIRKISPDEFEMSRDKGKLVRYKKVYIPRAVR